GLHGGRPKSERRAARDRATSVETKKPRWILGPSIVTRERDVVSGRVLGERYVTRAGSRVTHGQRGNAGAEMVNRSDSAPSGTGFLARNRNITGTRKSDRIVDDVSPPT